MTRASYVRGSALVATVGGFIAIAVAVAGLTGAHLSILQTRSGFACYNAVPPCAPLSDSIVVFNPNWENGLAIALLVAIVAVTAVALIRGRRQTSNGDPTADPELR